MQYRTWMKRLAVLTSLAAGSWVVGCGSSNNNNNDGSTGGRGGNGGAGGIGGAGGSPHDGGPGDGGTVTSDGQIAGVMIEANSGEVSAALIALANSTSAPVTSFATMMVTDHTTANARLANLLRQASITVEESGLRQTLAMQAAQTVKTLLSEPSTTFDRTYVSSQVTVHTMVLQLLDNQLIPNAQNASLKAELQSERMTVMSHLTEAQQLSTSLADGGVTDAGGTGDGGGAVDAAQGN